MNAPTSHNRQLSQRNHLLLLVGIILLGFLLRVFHINTVSLRGDEAFTIIHWMREPFGQTVSTIATIDPQPPLAYLTYRAYSLIIGSNELIVRYLPALINLLGVPALYGIGHRIGGRRLGYVCALVFACAPYAIWHAQDARNYALWLAFSAVALWLALCALERGRWQNWLFYIAAAVVACYLYYLELFVLLCLNLYVFAVYWRSWHVLRRWLLAQVIIVLFLLPWFAQPQLLSGGGYGGTAGRVDPLLWLTWFVPTLFFGVGYSQSTAPYLSPLALIVYTGGAWVLYRRYGRRYVLLFSLLGTVPLFLLGIVSLRLNVFVPRYVLAASIAYMVLFSAFIVGILHSRKRLIRLGGIAVTVLVIVFGFISLWNYYFAPDYAKSPDWRSLAEYLATNASTDDSIINTAADPALSFYLNENRVGTQEFYLPANPNQPTQEITDILDRQLEAGALWVVAQTPLNWANNGVVETHLDGVAQQLRAIEVNGLRVLEYLPFDMSQENRSALTSFEGVADLVDAYIWREPDNSLTVWLDWLPTAQTATPLKDFVHLIGSINPETGTPLWSQDDQFPQRGRISTADWQTGELYRDVFSIPLNNVLNGEYQVVVGWYDPVTGERVTTNDSDHFVIGTVELE